MRCLALIPILVLVACGGQDRDRPFEEDEDVAYVAGKTPLDAGAADRDFLEAKIATGRFYMARQQPASGMHLARIETVRHDPADLAGPGRRHL